MTDNYHETSLPASVTSERMVLGSILLDNSTLAEAREKLSPKDLSLDSHQRIYQRMLDLDTGGHAIDIVTLANELARKKELETVGGVAYLSGLVEGLPRRPAIDEYVSIVRDRSLLRQIILTCNATIARASDQSETALDVLTYHEGKLETLTNASEESSDLESVGQWLKQNDVFAERVPGIMSGIDAYDELTMGFQVGELTVIGARTSMGKTSHACTITWQMAKRGKSVAVYLNEQHKRSFIGRMLCGCSHVSFKTFCASRLDWVEKQYIEDAEREFKTLPIFWDHQNWMTVASIKAKSKRLHRSGDLDIILIDQLTGISNEGFWEKGKRSDEIIGDKVRAIKALAAELGVPIILYHQLNRSSTKNKDSRPSLADLQDSGKIEQHADNVDLLHRPSYYDRGSQEDDLIIRAKSRDGETGDVHCEFVPSMCLWRNKKK